MSSSNGRYPHFARMYPKLAEWGEQNGVTEFRREMLAPVHGMVVEVGAGHGLNFPLYPDSAESVTAVEPEPLLREQAETAAVRGRVPIRVVDGLAEDLPVDTGSVDCVVTSLTLCSVNRVDETLAEIARVLRPEGSLCFLEHTRARTAGYARYQRVMDLLWPHISGNCHVSRDLESAVTRSGLVMEQLRRFRFPPGRVPAPAAPTMIGRARRAV